MTTLWLDTETFCACDLKAYGTPLYAEHPSAESWSFGGAVDEDKPVVEDLTGRPARLLEPLEDQEISERPAVPS